MSDVPRGWYPYSADRKVSQLRWSDLTISSCKNESRRLWDGKQFVGPTVSNQDIVGIGTCASCKRYTGLVALSKAEQARRDGSALIEGLFVWRGAEPLKRYWSVLFDKSYATGACLECGMQLSFCPRCRQYNVAGLPYSTCPKCGRTHL
jgi:hypothetical protein